MDMHRDFLELPHRRTEPGEILVRRVLEINRDMDVGHAEAADTCRLVRQSLFMAVKPEIDDMADAQRLDVRELLFGRLTGRCHSIIKSAPVVDRFRVSHHSLDSGFGWGARRGTRPISVDSFPLMSNPRFPRASRAFD